MGVEVGASDYSYESERLNREWEVTYKYRPMEARIPVAPASPEVKRRMARDLRAKAKELYQEADKAEQVETALVSEYGPRCSTR